MDKSFPKGTLVIEFNYRLESMQRQTLLQAVFRFGVRQKIILILIAVLLTALTVSSWLAFHQEREEALGEISNRGQDISRFVARSLVNHVVAYDYHSIQLLLNELVLADDIGYARVISQKGNVMASAGDRYTGISSDGIASIVMFEQPVQLDSSVIGHLIIGLSTQKAMRQLSEKKASLIQREVLVVLLIAIGEFIALSLYIIRPVCRITESLNSRMTNLSEDPQLIVNSNDEFGYLASTFNRLYRQLIKANRKLKTKVQAADKELLKSNEALREQSEELRRMSDEFERMSLTDALTGLYNRRHFEKELIESMSLARRHGDINSVLIIDLDYFKRVNDDHGHPFGDKVLQEVSTRLAGAVRDTDVVCRIGGEEFAIICRRAFKDDAKVIANKLRKEIKATPFEFSGISVNLTVSVGVSTIGDRTTLDNDFVLYEQADNAVYYSKGTGRDRVTHFDRINPMRVIA